MRQIPAFLTFFILLSTSLLAQQGGSVKGIAYDTVLQKPVADASVTVLAKKDSSLVSFSITDNKGYFYMDRLAPGEYRLLITHINYHNKSSFFTISAESRDMDLGQLPLPDRATVLNEVTVSNEAPPVMLLGDTIQYNAGSFKAPPNASVEQLLKKLPGMEVDKDGTITAQGQKVNKVLVDGKEFFGNDAKMATRNLPADAIDKVQVYDRMSDQAQLTGFDDGNSEKTINLKLRKDRKKGVFGKVTAGAGTDDRFEGRFNVNSFKGARQVSAIGMANNTNTQGFTFSDMLNFTGELGRMMRGNGSSAVSPDDAGLATMTSNSNKGIRTIWGGGVNYNNILGSRTEMTSNYFYNQFNPAVSSDILRQYLLPDSSYFYNLRSVSDDRYGSHRLNLSFDHIIDSFHSIKISPSLGYQSTKALSSREYEQSGADGQKSNQGYSRNQNASNGFNFRNDLLFRKKFRKKGRTVSLSLNTSLNSSDADGSLSLLNNFYAPDGDLLHTQLINQQVITEGSLKGYTARLAYTEPVFTRSLLELSIVKSNTLSVSNKLTLDYDPVSDKYDRRNDSLSNDFRNTYGFTSTGLRLRTQKRKYNYFVGLSWQQADLEGKVIAGAKDSVIGRRFHNLLPTARFQYNFNRNKNLVLFYRTNTSQPTISQLQPVPDISDALYIREGNPNLKQEYIHSLQLNYTGISPFKGKSLFAFFTVSRTHNKIVSADSLLSSGVKKTRPVNTGGVYNINGDISLSLPLRFMKSGIRLGSNMFYSRNRQFINGVSNIISTLNAGPRLRLDINLHEKLDWNIGTSLNYTSTSYSLQRSFSTSYFSQVHEASIGWQLPKGFYVNTDLVYTVNSQLADGFNARIPLWGAWVSKQFLKYNKGELRLQVSDILNRNAGVSRSSNQNYIEDSRVNTLRRYALLSFTYSLSKTGLGNRSGNGPVIMTAR